MPINNGELELQKFLGKLELKLPLNSVRQFQLYSQILIEAK